MTSIIQGAQPRILDVRVDLGRRQVGMPEHHLDGAQVGPVLQQVRGKRMTQFVRRKMGSQSK